METREPANYGAIFRIAYTLGYIITNITAIEAFYPMLRGYIFLVIAVIIQFVLLIQDGCELRLCNSHRSSQSEFRSSQNELRVAQFVTTGTISAPFVLVILGVLSMAILDSNISAESIAVVSTVIIIILRCIPLISIRESLAWKLLYQSDL